MITVREGTPGDAPVLLVLLDKIDKKEKSFLAFNMKSTLIKAQIKTGKHIIIALDDGRAVGFARESGRPNNSSMLEEIYVDPDYRGKGVATAIINYMNTKFDSIQGKIKSDNTNMINLAKNQGFEVIKTTPKGTVAMWEKKASRNINLGGNNMYRELLDIFKEAADTTSAEELELFADEVLEEMVKEAGFLDLRRDYKESVGELDKEYHALEDQIKDRAKDRLNKFIAVHGRKPTSKELKSLEDQYMADFWNMIDNVAPTLEALKDRMVMEDPYFNRKNTALRFGTGLGTFGAITGGLVGATDAASKASNIAKGALKGTGVGAAVGLAAGALSGYRAGNYQDKAALKRLEGKTAFYSELLNGFEKVAAELSDEELEVLSYELLDELLKEARNKVYLTPMPENTMPEGGTGFMATVKDKPWYRIGDVKGYKTITQSHMAGADPQTIKELETLVARGEQDEARRLLLQAADKSKVVGSVAYASPRPLLFSKGKYDKASAYPRLSINLVPEDQFDVRYADKIDEFSKLRGFRDAVRLSGKQAFYSELLNGFEKVAAELSDEELEVLSYELLDELLKIAGDENPSLEKEASYNYIDELLKIAKDDNEIGAWEGAKAGAKTGTILGGIGGALAGAAGGNYIIKGIPLSPKAVAKIIGGGAVGGGAVGAAGGGLAGGAFGVPVGYSLGKKEASYNYIDELLKIAKDDRPSTAASGATGAVTGGILGAGAGATTSVALGYEDYKRKLTSLANQNYEAAAEKIEHAARVEADKVIDTLLDEGYRTESRVWSAFAPNGELNEEGVSKFNEISEKIITPKRDKALQKAFSEQEKWITSNLRNIKNYKTPIGVGAAIGGTAGAALGVPTGIFISELKGVREQVGKLNTKEASYSYIDELLKIAKNDQEWGAWEGAKAGGHAGALLGGTVGAASGLMAAPFLRGAGAGIKGVAAATAGLGAAGAVGTGATGAMIGAPVGHVLGKKERKRNNNLTIKAASETSTLEKEAKLLPLNLPSPKQFVDSLRTGAKSTQQATDNAVNAAGAAAQKTTKTTKAETSKVKNKPEGSFIKRHPYVSTLAGVGVGATIPGITSAVQQAGASAVPVQPPQYYQQPY